MIGALILTLFLCISTIFAEDTISKDSNSLSKISPLRTTRLAFVGINSFVLPQAEVTSIIASTTDSVIFASTVQSTIQENELPLFKITLKNNSNNTEITNTYQGSSVLYSGLTEGLYTIIIQGFVPSQWQSQPMILNFVVDNKRAKNYKGSKPTPIDSLADTSKLAVEKYEKSQKETTTLLIYLIVGSILISSIAVFIFFYIHNDKQKNAVSAGKKAVEKKSNVWFKKIAVLFTFPKKTKSKVNIPNQNSQLHNPNTIEQNNRSNEITKMLQSKVMMLEKEISLLTQKTSELSKRNNELHYTIDKFDGSEEMLKQLQSQKEALTLMYHSDKIWLPSDEEVSFMMDIIEGYDLNAINQQQVALEIKEVANSISNISRDITKVLMLETEKVTVETSPNDIQKLIVSTHKKYKKLCDEKEISLNFSPLTQIPPFLFDPIKIEEAYEYLLNNAITYSYPKTGVTVSAFIENKNVVVEINDQGPGITKEELYSAFTKGAEKLSTTRSDQQVKGVSLWVVKKMIDAHNGKIWVKSRIGKGATFAFSLPLE